MVKADGVKHSSHTECTDFLKKISATKHNIYGLHAHLETTIGCGDLPEH